jgi:hypothetical protein
MGERQRGRRFRGEAFRDDRSDKAWIDFPALTFDVKMRARLLYWDKLS